MSYWERYLYLPIFLICSYNKMLGIRGYGWQNSSRLPLAKAELRTVHQFTSHQVIYIYCIYIFMYWWVWTAERLSTGCLHGFLWAVNVYYVVIVGIGGSGRQSASRLAAFMADYELFQIEITKNYTVSDWRDDLRRMMRKAGEEGTSMVFLFGDHQIKVRAQRYTDIHIKVKVRVLRDTLIYT